MDVLSKDAVEHVRRHDEALQHLGADGPGAGGGLGDLVELHGLGLPGGFRLPLVLQALRLLGLPRAIGTAQVLLELLGVARADFKLRHRGGEHGSGQGLPDVPDVLPALLIQEMHGQSLHLHTRRLVAMACILHEFVDETTGARRIRRGRLRAVIARTQLPSVVSLHAERNMMAPPRFHNCRPPPQKALRAALRTPI